MFNGYGFGSLTNQNNVSTNVSSFAPSMPGYAGIDQLKFADMRTPEDQIHWLYLYAIQLSKGFITREEAEELIKAAEEALKAYSDAQDAKQDEAFALDQARQDADVLKRYYYLLDLINESGKFDGSCFDPTIGHSRNIKKVLERVYDFDRIFAVTAGDYDKDYQLTAAEYDALATTARDYDVDFALLNYNDSREITTATPQSTNIVRRLKRTIGGSASILTFVKPLAQNGEEISLAIDDTLKIEDGQLGVAESAPTEYYPPLMSDEGGVGLTYGLGLTLNETILEVDPSYITNTVNVITPLTVETAPSARSRSVAIGSSAKAQNTGVSVGDSATAELADSVAVGYAANATYRSVAVGSNAVTSASDAVSLGYNSTTSTPKTVSVGNSTTGLYRKIVNLAHPTDNHDAATKYYVDTAIAAISVPTITPATVISESKVDEENSVVNVLNDGERYSLLSGSIITGTSTEGVTIHTLPLNMDFDATKGVNSQDIAVLVFRPTSDQLDSEGTVSRVMMHLVSTTYEGATKLALQVANSPLTLETGIPYTLSF